MNNEGRQKTEEQILIWKHTVASETNANVIDGYNDPNIEHQISIYS